MSIDAPLLEAHEIGRQDRKNGTWLIRDVSLAVRPGDRITLTGPTGSGKTVLVRSLSMLDALDAGHIFWHGESPESGEIPVYRSHVIYLAQRARLRHGTVEENLRLPFSLSVHRGRQYSPETIAAYLGSLGRDTGFLALDSANLSGGESQIVALLRAIQLAPTILLLDEPTASLDVTTTDQIEQLVSNWMSEGPDGRAFVWVTHDAEQAARVANRRFEFLEGEIIESEASR